MTFPNNAKVYGIREQINGQPVAISFNDLLRAMKTPDKAGETAIQVFRALQQRYAGWLLGSSQ